MSCFCLLLKESFALSQHLGDIEPSSTLPPAPHELRVHYRETQSLDPGLVFDVISSAVTHQLFSGLLTMSPDMSVMPDVARSWEVSDDGRKFIFHLREDVHWSDGVQVTAHDFEFAWKRALNPTSDNATVDVLYGIKGARSFHQSDGSNPDLVGIQALDETKFSVELENPTGYFLSLLATLALTLPIPRHIVNKYGEEWVNPENIVTNGPFRLVSWDPDKSLVLVRNEGFHGKSTGNTQRVRLLSFSGDTDVDLLKFEGNNLDVLDMSYFHPFEIEHLRQRYIEDYATFPSFSSYYVGFDVTRPPFDDPKVRRAFALAIDKEGLANVFMRGTVSPATGGFVPPGLPGHSPGIGVPYDPELARQLLADAGYKAEEDMVFHKLTALTGSEGMRMYASDYIAKQLFKNLRIKIVWKLLDFGEFVEILYDDVPNIYINGWTADYPDPNSFISSTYVARRTGWDNEEFNRLVAKAQRLMDQEKRMKIYRQAEKILMDESPIIPLFHQRGHYLVKPWVRNFFVSPMYRWDFKNIIIEPH